MREWWSKVRQLLHRRRDLDDELSDELRSHLDFLIEENVAGGMPTEEACATARRRLGNEMTTRERAREAWQFPKLETILQDLRFGFFCRRRVGMRPVARNAEPLKFLRLHIFPFVGKSPALGAELQHRALGYCDVLEY